MGHISACSRLSTASWQWEGAGKHSCATCTMSLNQHQTSAEAPTATETSQCSQFGTLLHVMALNSQLSGGFHTGSLSGPEQAAQHQLRHTSQTPRIVWALGGSCFPGGDVKAAGQGQAPSDPSVASPVTGTISCRSHEPVTSFLSLWSQDSGFTGKFGKSE